MKRLVGYITTSFPDKNFTIDLALAMGEAGVDTLELGIPFSDPVADGPIIEKANFLALENGFKMNDLFEVSKAIAPHIDTLWMGYFNPFYHRGMEQMTKEARGSGVNGFIIPDLPFEEAQRYRPFTDNSDLALIDFIAPTDTEERIALISPNARKFIYLVAYAGITGSGKSESLVQIIENIRRYSQTPVYVGFGVDQNTAKEKVKGVDGVIVGSAFVKILLEEHKTYKEKISKITEIAREIKNKINE